MPTVTGQPVVDFIIVVGAVCAALTSILGFPVVLWKTLKGSSKAIASIEAIPASITSLHETLTQHTKDDAEAVQRLDERLDRLESAIVDPTGSLQMRFLDLRNAMAATTLSADTIERVITELAPERRGKRRAVGG